MAGVMSLPANIAKIVASQLAMQTAQINGHTDGKTAEVNAHTTTKTTEVTGAVNTHVTNETNVMEAAIAGVSSGAGSADGPVDGGTFTDEFTQTTNLDGGTF